jgi:hypothetical protein
MWASGESMAQKKLRCYFGLHRFVRRRNDDGQWYDECRDCGKFMIIDEREPVGGPQ